MTSCIIGDPRTTEFENATSNKLSVSYTDRGFRMDQKIKIDPHAVERLWPNYHFSKLANLKVTEGMRRFGLSTKGASRLAAYCAKMCTLTYWGEGRLTIREWEGYADE